MLNTVPRNANKEIVDLTFNLLSCIYERFHIFPSKTFPYVWFSSPFIKPENHHHFKIHLLSLSRFTFYCDPKILGTNSFVQSQLLL